MESVLLIYGIQNNLYKQCRSFISHKLSFQNIETGRKTVVICEDDPDLLNLFRMVFKSKYNVIAISSGKDCIEKFMEEKNRGNKIHLILLDYRLSDISGDSVARKIKENNGTKIILISAYNIDDSLLDELIESNMIAKYVKKPIYLSNLIKLVEETIRE